MLNTYKEKRAEINGQLADRVVELATMADNEAVTPEEMSTSGASTSRLADAQGNLMRHRLKLMR